MTTFLCATFLAARGRADAIEADVTPLNLRVLPVAQRGPWEAYIRQSDHWHQVDTNAFRAELKTAGLTKPMLPPAVHDFTFDPSKRDSWYGSKAGIHEADVILSYQTPSGGWSKHVNMDGPERKKGETFGPEISYTATIDNDATTTELRVLAKVYAATGKDVYRKAFVRGIQYLLNAQYPNGGWPQIYPLRGGYHDCVTYNDGAMIETMGVLRDVAEAAPDYGIVPEEMRSEARVAIEKGLRCVLETQIIVDGKRTAWCQQYSPITLKPAPARAFEMISNSAGESSGIISYLMKLKKPSPEVIAAVDGAVAWFKKTAIEGYRWGRVPGRGRRLTKVPGAGPIWARYAEIGTDRPLFGDRDRSIHYNVDNISWERRNGYGWYGNWPDSVLKRFPKWKARIDSGVDHG